jgi:transcriptional regulator with XRE-family HTH domain
MTHARQKMKEWRGRQIPPLSQADLGEKLGLSFMQIHRIETGKADPRLATMQLLQDLGVADVADWAEVPEPVCHDSRDDQAA